MRLYNILIAATLGAVTLTACNDDDFLEEHPKSSYTIDNAFTKSSQVEAQVTKGYYDLFDWYGCTFERFFSAIDRFKSIGTDEMDYPYWQHDGAAGYSNFGTWNTNSGWIIDVWNSLYKVIGDANNALDQSNNPAISWSSDADRTETRMEARFLRGYSYLRLAEMFGGVPLVDRYEKELRFDYTRASRTETYQFAINDLQAALDSLPDYPKEDGRVGKGAANHFLAEAYLGLGVETKDNSCYERAAKYASDAIALHPLMTQRFGVRANKDNTSSIRGAATYLPNGNVYGDLFYIGNFDRSEGNTEAMWVIETPTYDQLRATGGQVGIDPFIYGMVARDLNWSDSYKEDGAAAGPWKDISDKYRTAMLPAYLGGMGAAQVAPTNYAAYTVWNDSSDLRYQQDVTVRYKYVCMDKNHSMYGKYVTGDMLDQNPNNISKFYPIFSKIIPLDEWSYEVSDEIHQTYAHDYYAARSGETYMLLAEAYLRLGQKAQAAEALNTVRRRAHCTKMYTAADVNINSILDERMRECLFEEARWCTFLRMEPEVWKQRIYDHSMFMKDYPKYNMKIEWNLWPIPKSVVDMNTGAPMEQNSGWK